MKLSYSNSKPVIVFIWLILLFSGHISNGLDDDNQSSEPITGMVSEQLGEADCHDDGTDEDQIIFLSAIDGNPTGRQIICLSDSINHFIFSNPLLLPPELNA